MISRRKVILALGASLVPAAAGATTPPKTAAAPATATTKPVAKKQVVKKKAPPPEPRLVITVNKVSQKMTVELDGNELYKWPVSTGAPGYDTPSGSFKPFRMEKEHFSKEWDDAPMPYSIFFTGEGHALHGSYHVNSLGRRASHGCVRILPANAAILFALVQKTGMSNTRVIIKGGFFADMEAPDALPKKNPFSSWFN
jgi:lipoprotein-anchoring transpeptidase ErfK/SrfK